MAEFSFNRVYHLQVISSRATGARVLEEITTNRLTANIKQSTVSSASSSNTNSITIYNLDRNVISSLREKGATVILRAGYSEQYPGRSPKEFPEIYKGEVVTCKIERTPSDTVVNIATGEIVSERKTALVSESFSRVTTLKYLVETIAKKTGLNTIVNLGTRDGLILNKQRSYSGEPLEILDKIAREFELKVYVSNKILQVYSKYEPEKLIDSPVIEIPPYKVKGALSLSTDYTRSAGGEQNVEVEFATFLDPRLVLNSRIRLEVEGKIGEFIIEVIQHTLDTHGNTWDTKISAKGLETVYTQLPAQETGTAFA